MVKFLITVFVGGLGWQVAMTWAAGGWRVAAHRLASAAHLPDAGHRPGAAAGRVVTWRAAGLLGWPGRDVVIFSNNAIKTNRAPDTLQNSVRGKLENGWVSKQNRELARLTQRGGPQLCYT